MSHAKAALPDGAGPLTRRLALLAHWGLEDAPCRPAPPQEPPDGGEEFLVLPAAQDLRFNLVPYADVVGHTCTTPAGMLGLPLRLLRGFFKVVIGPWLDIQTLFNQAVIKTLLHDQTSSRNYLEQLVRHVRNQRGVVDDFGERLDRDLKSLGQMQRLDVRHVVEALEQSVARHAVAPVDGNEAATRALEQVFLQAWLPRPPARLLAVGDMDGDGLELADLGYQVVADSGLPASDESRYAYSAGAFDAVVCLARSSAVRGLLNAFQCLLRSGGRAIVAVTLDEGGRQPPPAGLRLLGTAYAVGARHASTYTAHQAVVDSP